MWIVCLPGWRKSSMMEVIFPVVSYRPVKVTVLNKHWSWIVNCLFPSFWVTLFLWLDDNVQKNLCRKLWTKIWMPSLLLRFQYDVYCELFQTFTVWWYWFWFWLLVRLSCRPHKYKHRRSDQFKKKRKQENYTVLYLCCCCCTVIWNYSKKYRYKVYCMHARRP